MSGWNELGAMLGGGGQLQQQARQMGIEQGARQADLLEQARQRRDENIGLQAITPDAISAAQSDPTGTGAATLVSALLHAKRNPNETTDSLKGLQGLGWGNQAMADATGPNPDLNLINRMNIVRNGKPVDLSTVQGDTLVNQMVTPDKQAAYGGNTPTQIGLADIMLKGAQAGDASAHAGEANAQRQRTLAGIGADKAGNYEVVQTDHGLVRVNKLDPTDAKSVTLSDMVLNKTGTGKSAASDPNSDASVLAQARQRIQSGADPKTVAAYLAGKGYPGVANKLLGNGAADGQ